jgi:phosphorylated adapter RNA export protein
MRASRSRERQAREEAAKRAAAAERQQRRAVQQAVEAIAAGLGETDERAREKIANSVTILGLADAQALYEEVQAIEAAGGMTTADGARRRTPGGVYHYLLKQRLTEAGRKDELKKI